MNQPKKLFNETAGPNVVETFTVPSRTERTLPAPAAFRTGAAAQFIRAQTGSLKVYRHQKIALEHVANDNNVVIATGTASGKSLVYQAAAIRGLVSSDAACLIISPQKSLIADQAARMTAAMRTASLDEGLVGIIDGDVPSGDRERILRDCRIIFITPDTLHSYVMRSAGTPATDQFLANVALIVLDEAHTLEGTFGTNCALLLRRLRAQRARISINLQVRQLVFIAATATILDPGEHLKRLTGLPFKVVGEDENGAPHCGLTVQHVEGPAVGAPSEKAAADMLRAIADKLPPGESFIAFADSRQGVERIVRSVGLESVVPYRSGYAASDRRNIEVALRRGQLSGTVSTSALELGIDIPQFTVGLNVGVPPTRKALKQRVGRTGRASEGVFSILAPASAFAMLGTTCREHFEGPVEPSPLYLDNPFILFQHACCYREEAALDEANLALDDEIDWPPAFLMMLRYSLPGSRRPPELDVLAAAGMNCPQLAFPLRRLCQSTYSLRLVGSNEEVGTIEAEKALREAYPGATYHHFNRSFRAAEWRPHSLRSTIYLQPIRKGETTTPLITTRVACSTSAEDVLERNLMESEAGLLVESRLRVTQAVEGYRLGNTTFLYRDLKAVDPRLSRKWREFNSTGVMLRICEPWFTGQSDHQLAARRSLGEALSALLAREHGIAPAEVRVAVSGIAIQAAAGPQKVDDAIVLYDDVPGGLRLTGPIFKNFGQMIQRLQRASDLAGEEALVGQSLVERLAEWFAKLEATRPTDKRPVTLANGSLLIYAPDSEVAVRMNGALVERRLCEPEFLDMPDGPVLMYRAESAPGVKCWVSHEHIEAIGHDWRHAHWNPVTNVIEEIAA